MKIKKCGEMARTLRFFKEQMLKAGVSPSAKSVEETETDVDDLEVHHLLPRNVLYYYRTHFFSL